MIGIISITVDQVLDETESFSNEARERLRDCLPMLEQGLDSWRDNGAYCPRNPQHILMAAATAKRATVFICCGWPKVPDVICDQRDVTAQVAHAIESGETSQATDIVAAGLTMILGDAGIAVQQKHSEQILALGGRPLLVALIEDDAVLVATVGLGLAVATIH